MSLHVPTLFTLLAPIFLVLGCFVAIRARRVTPQARTWLLIGGIFAFVAFWLRLHPA